MAAIDLTNATKIFNRGNGMQKNAKKVVKDTPPAFPKPLIRPGS